MSCCCYVHPMGERTLALVANGFTSECKGVVLGAEVITSFMKHNLQVGIGRLPGILNG